MSLEPPTEDVDLLVVGGGKAGKSLAMDRANAGWNVVMVERDKIGGTCINVACIPTKALVASARALISARVADRLGVDLQVASTTVDALRRHKEGVVDQMVDAHRRMFAEAGMDFVLGSARFVGPRTVEITEAAGSDHDGPRRRVRGREVVINTGTTPHVPQLPGLVETGAWDSERVLELDELPTSLVVLGGGYVGCEFASMFAAFGSRVTLVQGAPQLLPREDADVAGEIADLLREQGVDVRMGARAVEVRRDDAARLVVSLSDGSDVHGTQLLYATGRTPVVADLDLEAAGVDLTDRGFVAVDEHLRTSAEHVWAAGDVAGSPQFTHASWHDFRILREILSGGDAVTTGRVMPYAVFVTPELGRVGLTETQARERGHRVRVAKIPVAAIPRAKTLRETAGSWKVVVDEDSEQILGVALIGPEAGDVIAAVQMAMLGGLPYHQVRDAPITHPTMAEGLNLLLDALA